jgi:putative PIN family toxin of toxin-antitoxin system
MGEILRRLRDGEFALLHTEPLLVELAEVIDRPRIRQKYGLGSEDIESVLALILLRGEPIDPARRTDIYRDPKANMILEAAVAGQADLIIGGDPNLLSLREFEGVPVISPAKFLQRLAKGPP